MSAKTRPASDELRPIEPGKLWDEWAERKGAHRRQNTVSLTREAWDLFEAWWASREDLSLLSDLGPYFAADCHDFIQQNTDTNKLTRFYTLTRLKSVIDYAKGKGYVRQDVPYDWDKPEIDRGDRQREDYLDPARGRDISDWVRLEYPAEKEQVIWKLAFHYGLRKSAIRAIDVNHVVLEPDGENPPHIKLRDRPHLGAPDDMGLPLKNTLEWLSDRLIPLKPNMVDVLERYINRNRTEPDGTDDYGLEGLITTQRSARMSANGIYLTLSKLTSPATYEGACDCDTCREFKEKHGRDCDCDWCMDYTAQENRPLLAQERYKCDWSRGPHAIRHGAITNMINQDVPIDTISHIVGTSAETIRKTYDRRTESERMNAIADGWLGGSA